MGLKVALRRPALQTSRVGFHPSWALLVSEMSFAASYPRKVAEGSGHSCVKLGGSEPWRGCRWESRDGGFWRVFEEWYRSISCGRACLVVLVVVELAWLLDIREFGYGNRTGSTYPTQLILDSRKCCSYRSIFSSDPPFPCM